MPFVTDYTPISAALALGGIAGAGTGMAQAAQRRLQDAQFIAQQYQENARRQAAADQALREQAAQDKQNQIQTALAYSKLQQEQQQNQQELELKKAQQQAEQLLASQKQSEGTRQFNEAQATKTASEKLAEQKYNEAQASQKTNEAEALRQIDSLYPAGSPENDRARAYLAANGKLPRPAAEQPAYHDIQALTTFLRNAVDFAGNPLPGYEQAVAAARQHMAGLIANQPQGISAPPPVQSFAPPQTQPQIVSAIPTGETTPEGIPLVQVQQSDGTSARVPSPQTADQYAALPPGSIWIDQNGLIKRKR